MNNTPTLLEELDRSHARALALITSLDDRLLDVPYHPGINPPIWEIGHCAYFFERFIFQHLDGNAPINPALNDIWDSFELAHEDRWTPGLFPNKADTLAYVERIHRAVRQRIQHKPLTDADLYLYKYAIFHLNMHIESLVWCRQTLGHPAPPSAVQSVPAPTTGEPSRLGDAHVPGGQYRIGMPAHSPDYAREGFCFDNEKPGFDMDIAPFSISKTLVSQGEFLAFVEAGGYERDEFWSMPGLKWRKQQEARHPLHWKKHQGQWLVHYFDQWLPLEPHLPVKHVSYWEAQAYCQFAGRRLPTEFEWEVAALGNTSAKATQGEFKQLPWGNAMHPNKVDMDATHMARLPVDALPEGDGPFGCRQMIGTVWEWTSSLFMPYDGFTMDVYPFMSTLQFATHKVVRGGSCATSSNLIRGTYRQAYLPERNDVFVGFRTCAL
ncbi:selenoneine synthase SenA [Limnobacter sp.]|uniref:selenoneine synthase SenA n=1 Tax=Limnobacter sp. TaxID=2003368 RepID=UPI0035111B45